MICGTDYRTDSAPFPAIYQQQKNGYIGPQLIAAKRKEKETNSAHFSSG